jgi:hypothetical protein
MKEFIGRAEQQQEANKANQTKIGIINMPVFVMPESAPATNHAPQESKTSSPFVDLIEILLEIIAETANAISSHDKK